MPPTLRWGILGTGRIARTLAKAIHECSTGELVACGSRSQETADRFGKEVDCPTRHGTYEALLADPDVQAVYISLPNHLHALWTIRCAEAGKHVLCEKPLATNAGEAMAALEAVRRAGVFFMEAFMYRCTAQTARIVQLVREGALGKVRTIQASFSYQLGPRYENIRLQNEAAGGGIQDVGCYTVSAARLIAGAALGRDFADPLDLKAAGHIGETSRVDEWASAVLRFDDDIVATVSCGTQVAMESVVRIWGSEGHLVVPNPWFPGRDPAKPDTLLLHRAGQEKEQIQVESHASLYAVEADTVARHLADRQAPPPCMTWADSLGQQQTLDRWRRALGLLFDREQPEAEVLRTPFSGRALRRRDDHTMLYGNIEGIATPVSRIVMGSMGLSIHDMPLACALLDDFFERGGTCIDTAYLYGQGICEQALGQWMKLRRNRDQIVLLGKGGHTPFCHPEAIVEQLEKSLERLQTDHIDLYMLHRDNPGIPVGAFIDCLEAQRRAGRIGAYGGSNWSLPRIEDANAYAASHGCPGFAAASNNLSLAEWNEPMWNDCRSISDPGSRAWHERTGLPNFAWSSQASGFFTGRFGREDARRAHLAQIVRVWFNDSNFTRLQRAGELARNKSTGATQIALAYVLQQPFPSFALIGPRTIEETRTSLEALRVELTPQEMKWLNLEA